MILSKEDRAAIVNRLETFAKHNMTAGSHTVCFPVPDELLPHEAVLYEHAYGDLNKLLSIIDSLCEKLEQQKSNYEEALDIINDRGQENLELREKIRRVESLMQQAHTYEHRTSGGKCRYGDEKCKAGKVYLPYLREALSAAPTVAETEKK